MNSCPVLCSSHFCCQVVPAKEATAIREYSFQCSTTMFGWVSSLTSTWVAGLEVSQRDTGTSLSLKCIPVPCVPQARGAHPLDVKENVIHHTRPPSPIAPRSCALGPALAPHQWASAACDPVTSSPLSLSWVTFDRWWPLQTGNTSCSSDPVV